MKTHFSIIFVICLATLISITSCGESEKERQQRTVIDSLQNVNYQGQMAYSDLQQYLAIIADGLDSISIEEREIYFNPTPGENRGYNKQRMRQKLAHVRELLSRHRERIEYLEGKLANGNGDAKRLQVIITALKEQLEQKDRELAKLRSDLDHSRKSISELQKQVTEMQDKQEEQQSTIEKQKELIEGQHAKLNMAYYKIATKKELKNEGLLSGGLLQKKKIDYGKIDTSTFQKINIHETTTLTVPEKCKILTPAPEGSYSIAGTTLTIHDPELFWSVSNYLIIQAN